MHSPHAQSNHARGASQKKLAIASTVGTTLEYYDFAVYNTLAALLFNRLFFPAFDPLSGTLLAFSTFAVGYFSRPVGGLIFGHLGDRYGRRFVLSTTLLVMGVTTILIGALPTYASIGALSPILLVVLRFVQGAALGGEWAGAVLLTAEHGRAEQRGRNAAWAQMGPSLGTLLATGVIAVLSSQMTEADFESWGWRLPFFASVVLAAFGLWVRAGVPETPEFERLARDEQRSHAPVLEVFREHKRGLLIGGAVRIGPDVLYSLVVVFSLTYLTTIAGVSRTLALTALSIGGACNALTIPLAGGLSDRFGRRAIYAFGAAAGLVWVVAFFGLLDSRDAWLITLAFVGALIVHALMYGPQAAFIAEQFPARVRYAGASLAYTLAGVVGGGVAPLVFAALYQRYESTLALAAYAALALLVTLAALHVARSASAR